MWIIASSPRHRRDFHTGTDARSTRARPDPAPPLADGLDAAVLALLQHGQHLRQPVVGEAVERPYLGRCRRGHHLAARHGLLVARDGRGGRGGCGGRHGRVVVGTSDAAGCGAATSTQSSSDAPDIASL